MLLRITFVLVMLSVQSAFAHRNIIDLDFLNPRQNKFEFKCENNQNKVAVVKQRFCMREYRSVAYFTTIQQALKNSSALDIIYVGPGVYNEFLSIGGKVGVTLTSPCKAQIQGLAISRSAGVTVEGFKITGSKYSAAVSIQKQNALVEFRNNEIVNNPYNGVVFDNQSIGGPFVLENNIISENGMNGVVLNSKNQTNFYFNKITFNGKNFKNSENAYGVSADAQSSKKHKLNYFYGNTIAYNNGLVVSGVSTQDIKFYKNLFHKNSKNNLTTTGIEGLGFGKAPSLDNEGPKLASITPPTESVIYTNQLPKAYAVQLRFDEVVKKILLNGAQQTIIEGENILLNLSLTQAGHSNFQIAAFDDYDNRTDFSFSKTVVFDNIAPGITMSEIPLLTNAGEVYLTFKVNDENEVWSDVLVNDQLLFSTRSTDVSTQIPLSLEGENKIQVISIDAAGNKTESTALKIIRDTTPALISEIKPENDSNIDRMIFNLSAVSNEKLQKAEVNGLPLTLSTDGKSVSGKYVSSEQGNVVLNWIFTDVAGNTSYNTTIVNISQKLLVGELVTIEPSLDGEHLRIIGKEASTRPHAIVKATTGLFSFNRGEAVSDANGSFMIELELFSSVKIEVTDPNTNEVSILNLNYNLDTSLSGLVADTQGNPLPEATISIAGFATSYKTNASGAFLIPDPPTGDQTLIIDGSTVPISVTGPNRQFFKTNIVINIGLGQRNTLSRPIYLAPLLLDGTETIVNANQEVTVESPAAPGVAINIPAGSVQFPNGSSGGKINISFVDSDKSTVKVPDSAVPNQVLSLEPSGLTFKERVQLTLPNDNELPPGVEVLILSMNSQKGIWEIDGIGQVTESGDSIQTKPTEGISHFSLVYAVPLTPNISTVKTPDLIGVNSSEGGLETGFKVPSFKIYDQEIAPNFHYKSTWAKPTAVISNIIDIPEKKTKVKKSYNNTLSTFISVDIDSCAVGGCGKPQDIYVKYEQYGTFNLTSWYVPESVQSQFFVSGITTDKVNFQLNENVNKLGKYTLPNEINSVIASYEGATRYARMSYGVELFSSQDDKYLESGIYPTLTRYQVNLRNLKLLSDSSGTQLYQGQTFIASRSDASKELSTMVKSLLPQDLISNIIVQNKTESPYGSGWHLGMSQRILNPRQNNIVVEEASGDLSTYSINNTITPILNTFDSFYDGRKGIDLSHWPKVLVTNFFQKSIHEYDMDNWNLRKIADTNGSTGLIGNDKHYSCAPQYSASVQFSPQYYRYNSKLDITSLLKVADGSIFILDQKEHSLYRYQNGIQEKVAGTEGPIFSLVEYETGAKTLNMSESDTQSFCFNQFGRSCTPEAAKGPFSCLAAKPIPCPPNVNCKPTPSATFIDTPGMIGVSGYKGDNISNGLSNSGNIAFNTPKAMILSSEGNLIIADTGNNRIREINFIDKKIQTIAGDGSNLESSVYHPQALALDSHGNLFFAQENGYIKKLDRNGVITNIGGKPIGLGGVFADEGPALNMALNNPSGLIVDKNNKFLYISDTNHHRILRLDIENEFITTVAGTKLCRNEIDYSDATKTALQQDVCNPTNLGFDEFENLIFVSNGKFLRLNFNVSPLGNIAFNPSKKDLSSLEKLSDGSWVRTYRSGDKIFFNSLGYETHQVSKSGQITEFEYDGSSRLTKVVFSNGKEVSYSYSGDKISSITDPAGRITRLYFSGNNLQQVTFPDGTSKKYFYNDKGLLSHEQNERDARTSYEYDDFFRLSKLVKPDNTVLVAQNGNLNTQGGTLKSTGLSENQVNDIVIDSNNNMTIIKRDYYGFPSQLKNAKGEITTIERDSDGKPIAISYQDGAKTVLEYNNTRDLISTTDVTTGIKEQREYNIAGQVTRIIDGNGNSSNFSYNPTNGLLITATYPQNKKVEYKYYSNGLVEQKIQYYLNDQKLITQYFYNSEGELVKIKDPSGNEIDLLYNAAGFLIEKNQGGLSKKYSYDLRNHLVKVTTPKNEVTEYSYLPTGELYQVKDPANNVTTYDFNIMGQVKQKLDPRGRVWSFDYDDQGNRILEKDPNNQTKIFSYNSLNQMIQANLPDDTLKYDYDLRGDMVYAQNKNSEVYFLRDTKKRITSYKHKGLGELADVGEYIFSSSYDNNGNRKTLNTPFGNWVYAYNEFNQLTALQNSQNELFAMNYDRMGRLSELTRSNNQKSVYSYYDNSMLGKIEHSQSGLVKSFVEYNYNSKLLISQKKTHLGNYSFDYDDSRQLTQVSSQNTASETIMYDSLGNRMQDESNNYLYDSKNQLLLSDNYYNYQYDNNGNLLSKISKDETRKTQAYSYSSQNQIVKVTINQGLAGPIEKEIFYFYDVLGRRIKKEVKNFVTNELQIRKYVYDGNDIIAELGDNNQVLASFTHSKMRADDILSVNITSNGVAAQLASAPGTFHYLKDALETVTDIANSSGNIIQSYRYSGFGKIQKITDGTGADITSNPVVNTRYTFTGRELDEETGLYYYRARYYDASLGRFLQEDPHPGNRIIPISVNNKYAYAANRPTQLADPSGMDAFSDISNFFSEATSFIHDMVASFGAAFDGMIKNPMVQLVIILVAAYFIGPQAFNTTAASMLITESANGVAAWYNGNNSFDAFWSGVGNQERMRNSAAFGLIGYGIGRGLMRLDLLSQGDVTMMGLASTYVGAFDTIKESEANGNERGFWGVGLLYILLAFM